MKGVEGVYRFLARVWRLVMEQNAEGEWSVSAALQDVPADKQVTKVLHETIKKCGEDIEKLSFNTAIAQMMVLTNAFTQTEVRPVTALVTFLKVLSPFAPHLAEELYAIIRSQFPQHVPAGFVADVVWPTYDPAALIDDEIEIVIQVNGKRRDSFTVPLNTSKEEIEKQALASPRVAEFTVGLTIRKVIYVPGNHDDRDAMRRLFAGAPWLSPTGFLHHVIDRGPLRIVMLDTLDPGRTAGILCAERLGWLKDRLDEHPGPVVVALHHPPFQVGVPFMDAVALDSPQALGDIVRRHANVLAVVCGHVHRSATVSFAGTVGISVPAVGHQLALEIGRTEFPRWTLEPPVVALHLWTPGGGLVSHLSPVGPWAPRPFRRGN
jgi:3',5'-cyclic AMP phosphodiesterase CpdA